MLRDPMEINELYDAYMAEGMSHYEAMHKTFEEMNKPRVLPLEAMIQNICDKAWKEEGNTTVNQMISWILRKVLVQVVPKIEDELNRLNIEIEELKNGKDGGLPKPKGRKSA